MGESGPPSAVCLIVLLGCLNPPNTDMYDDGKSRMDLAPFPANDVFRLVVLDKDEFGIAQAIHNVGDESEFREIYCSHDCMSYESSSAKMLRESSSRGEHVEDLFQALKLSERNEEGERTAETGGTGRLAGTH